MRHVLRNMLDDRKFIYQKYLINYVDYRSHTASLAQMVELCEYVDEDHPYSKHILRAMVNRRRRIKLNMHSSFKLPYPAIRYLLMIKDQWEGKSRLRDFND